MLEPTDSTPPALPTSTSEPDAPRIDLGSVADAAERVRTEIGRALVGQEERVTLLLTALLAGGHVLLEGVPGIAKTLTARLLARTVDADYRRIQFTPDLMPSDVVGTAVFNPRDAEFSFRAGPIFSNFVLIDEINRAPAKTQSALFEVMEERQATVDGTTYPMAEPFMVLATQNPLEHEGTYRLPEAQLDRFLFKLVLDYPTADEEVEILTRALTQAPSAVVETIGAVLSKSELAQARGVVSQVRVEPPVVRYIAGITLATRGNASLMLGASPRASLSLLSSGRAYAVLAGRDYVLPDDIQAVAPHVLRHRIQLAPELEMEGRAPDEVVADILRQVEIPR